MSAWRSVYSIHCEVTAFTLATLNIRHCLLNAPRRSCSLGRHSPTERSAILGSTTGGDRGGAGVGARPAALPTFTSAALWLGRAGRIKGPGNQENDILG